MTLRIAATFALSLLFFPLSQPLVSDDNLRDPLWLTMPDWGVDSFILIHELDTFIEDQPAGSPLKVLIDAAGARADRLQGFVSMDSDHESTLRVCLGMWSIEPGVAWPREAASRLEAIDDADSWHLLDEWHVFSHHRAIYACNVNYDIIGRSLMTSSQPPLPGLTWEGTLRPSEEGWAELFQDPFDIFWPEMLWTTEATLYFHHQGGRLVISHEMGLAFMRELDEWMHSPAGVRVQEWLSATPLRFDSAVVAPPLWIEDARG